MDNLSYNTTAPVVRNASLALVQMSRKNNHGGNFLVGWEGSISISECPRLLHDTINPYAIILFSTHHSKAPFMNARCDVGVGSGSLLVA